jgi:hypothetical protein
MNLAKRSLVVDGIQTRFVYLVGRAAARLSFLDTPVQSAVLYVQVWNRGIGGVLKGSLSMSAGVVTYMHLR